MTSKTSRKKWTLAICIIAVAAALVGTLIVYPTFASGSQTTQSLSPSNISVQDFKLTDPDWQNINQLLTLNGTCLNGENVTAECGGWAFQRIDNETIKEYALELNLTIQLGAKNGAKVSITSVSGTISVNSTTFNAVYNIQTGNGIIETNRHVALIQAEGVNGQDNVTLKAEAFYLYWGGKEFAFRGRALLEESGQKPMLLLLRYGVAKVQ